MKRMKRVRLLLVPLLVMAMIIPVLPAGPAYGCTAGLTPGFWKNHTSIWEGDYGGLTFSGIFGVGDDISLLEALNAEGGGENALMRHAAAAWLNSKYILLSTTGEDFLTSEEVINIVKAAFGVGLGDLGPTSWAGMMGDMEFWKDYLEASNELGYDGPKFW